MNHATMIWWLSPEEVLDIVYRLENKTLVIPRPLEKVIRNLDDEDPSDFESKVLLEPEGVDAPLMNEVIVPPEFAGNRVGIFITVDHLIAVHQAGGIVTNLTLAPMEFVPVTTRAPSPHYELQATYFCLFLNREEMIDITTRESRGLYKRDYDSTVMIPSHVEHLCWAHLGDDDALLDPGVFSLVTGHSPEQFVIDLPVEELDVRKSTGIGIIMESYNLTPSLQHIGKLVPCFRAETIEYVLRPKVSRLTRPAVEDDSFNRKDKFPLEKNGMPFTVDEVRELFLKHIRGVVGYWDDLYNKNEVTARDAMEGCVHSTLAMLDGSCIDLPGFLIVPDAHADDWKYHLETGSRPFPPIAPVLREQLIDIGGSLAYGFYHPQEDPVRARNHISLTQWKDGLRTGEWTFMGDVMLKQSDWFNQLRQQPNADIIKALSDKHRELCMIALECDLFFVHDDWDMVSPEYSFKFATNEDEKLKKFIGMTDLPIRTNF